MRALAPLLASLLVVAMAGCGSSSSGPTYSVNASTTMTAADISRAGFVKQINEICEESWVTIRDNYRSYRRRARRAGADTDGSVPPQAFILAELDFHIFDNFRILGAPPGEEESIEAIIGPFQYAVETGQAEEPPRIASPAEAALRFTEYNRLARAYGLDQCLVTEQHLPVIVF